MTWRKSSGSSFSASGVEPTRSQNITVSCRRSASGEVGWDLAVVGAAAGRLAFLVLGVAVRVRLLTSRGFSAAHRVVPHSPQNLACGAFSPPHWAQRRFSEVPHSVQNFSPSGFSKPQLAQRIRPLYSFGLSRARKIPARPQSGGNLLLRARGLLSPSLYCAPAYTAGSNSAPLSRRKVDSATCNSFQITAVAFSTFLNRFAAVVRSRTVANGDSTTLLVRKCTQCSRGNW